MKVNSIGDGITTWFDTLGFLAIFVGIPALILGLPVAGLIFLSMRRQRILDSTKSYRVQQLSTSRPWLFALLAFLGMTAIVFFLTAVGFTT